MRRPLALASCVVASFAACVDIGDVQSNGDAGAADASVDAPIVPVDGSTGDAIGSDASSIDGSSSNDGATVVDSGCSPNLLTDASNCGRCGHACDSGTSCTNGVCAPTPLRNGGGEITSLRLIGGTLYWMEGGAALYACAAPGCAASSLVPIVTGAQLLGYGIGGSTAYTVEGLEPQLTNHPRYVRSYPATTAGSATDVTYSGGLYGLEGPVDVDSQEVWFFPWLNGGPQEFGSVSRSDTGTSTFAHSVTQDVSLPATMLRLATLGGNQYAFWSESTRVVRVRTVDSASTTTMATGTGFGGLAVDGTYLFFTSETDGTVVRCDAQSDCSAKKTVASAQNHPSRVAIDGAGIAFTSRGGGGDGAVSECSYPDCAEGPFVIAKGQSLPHEIAMDAKYVYWAAGSNLYRTTR